MFITILIMVFASAGNILSMTVLKSPILSFFWYHVLFCLIIPVGNNFWIKKRGIKEYLESINLVKPIAKKYYIFSILIGIIFISLSIFLYYISDTSSIKLMISNITIQFVIVGVIYTIFLNGILEEIFWRGFIHNRIKSVNEFLSILINSLFFTSFHVFIILDFLKFSILSIVIILLIFSSAIIFDLLRIKSKSILPSILLHFLVSIGYSMIFLLIYFS